MNEHKPPARANQRTASLFRNGRNQAVRIPVEFELPGDEVLITKTGQKLVIEPKAVDRETWEDFLNSLEAFPDFPDVERGPAPDVNL